MGRAYACTLGPPELTRTCSSARSQRLRHDPRLCLTVRSYAVWVAEESGLLLGRRCFAERHEVRRELGVPELQ